MIHVLSYGVQIFTEVSHQAIFWPSMSGKIRFVWKMENKGIKPEVHCLVIADFYQKNVHEGKFYSFKYFKHMGNQTMHVYTVW